MAHFAQIGESNKVTRVVCIDNAAEHEAETILAQIDPTWPWVKTSYNGSIRGCFAGVGFTYDAEADVFVPPPSEPIQDLTQ